jgi:3-isopropylmalate dehydrogenase
MTFKIAYLPGDGIGVDVLEAAKIVLDATSFDAEYIHGDIGWHFWENEGDALPDRTVALLKETDACLFGAITSKSNVAGYRSPIVRLRQIFDLYSNMRPCKAFPGNTLNYNDEIDMVVFRENTEGLYAGVEFSPEEFSQLQGIEKFKKFDPKTTAVSCRVFTEKGCNRIVRKAFEFAKEYGYPHVTVVHKANVVRETSGMFLREARKVAVDFPEIKMYDANVDAMCMWMLKNPLDYGVIVCTNMFGDIISDLSAQLVGGLGFAASASTSDKYGVFEPTHGSAPKYAGQYKVNPAAAILSAKLMVEWLGEKDIGKKIGDAVVKWVKESSVKTYDMGGTASTLEVAHEIVRIMNE